MTTTQQDADDPFRPWTRNVHSNIVDLLPSIWVRRTTPRKGLIERHASLTEQEFRVKSDEALEAARRALLPLADSEGFEVELQNGVLNLVFEEPSETKFVVSPNAPVRQIWVSAMARSYKLSWAPELERVRAGRRNAAAAARTPDAGVSGGRMKTVADRRR